MKWSRQKPVQKGWYWYRGFGYPTIVHVYEINACLYIEGQFYCGPVWEYTGEWAGPIPAPEAHE